MGAFTVEVSREQPEVVVVSHHAVFAQALTSALEQAGFCVTRAPTVGKETAYTLWLDDSQDLSLGARKELLEHQSAVVRGSQAPVIWLRFDQLASVAENDAFQQELLLQEVLGAQMNECVPQATTLWCNHVVIPQATPLSIVDERLRHALATHRQVEGGVTWTPFWYEDCAACVAQHLLVEGGKGSFTGTESVAVSDTLSVLRRRLSLDKSGSPLALPRIEAGKGSQGRGVEAITEELAAYLENTIASLTVTPTQAVPLSATGKIVDRQAKKQRSKRTLKRGLRLLLAAILSGVVGVGVASAATAALYLRLTAGLSGSNPLQSQLPTPQSLSWVQWGVGTVGSFASVLTGKSASEMLETLHVLSTAGHTLATLAEVETQYHEALARVMQGKMPDVLPTQQTLQELADIIARLNLEARVRGDGQGAETSELAQLRTYLLTLQTLHPVLESLTTKPQTLAIVSLDTSVVRPGGGKPGAALVIKTDPAREGSAAVVDLETLVPSVGGKVEIPPAAKLFTASRSWTPVDTFVSPIAKANHADLRWFLAKSLGLQDVDALLVLPHTLTRGTSVEALRSFQELLKGGTREQRRDVLRSTLTALKRTEATLSLSGTHGGVPTMLGWDGYDTPPLCPSAFALKSCVVESLGVYESQDASSSGVLTRSMQHTVTLAATGTLHERSVLLINGPESSYSGRLLFSFDSPQTTAKVLANLTELAASQYQLASASARTQLVVPVRLRPSERVIISTRYTTPGWATTNSSYVFFERMQAGRGKTPLELHIQYPPEATVTGIAPRAETEGSGVRFTTTHDEPRVMGVSFL